MDQFLDEFTKSNTSKLVIKDELILRENLRRLEEECKAEFKAGDGRDDEELMRRLWLILARMSVKLRNVELSLLVVAKLKLVQLALLLRSTLQRQDKTSRSIALSYMSNYFNLDTDKEQIINTIITGPREQHLVFDCDKIIEYYINRGQWNKALGLFESGQAFSERQKELNRQVIFHKLARHSEVDEDFHAALTNYELSDTLVDNSPRVIIKQSLDLAYTQLKQYCSMKKDSLSHFWQEYSFGCGKYTHSNELINSCDSFVFYFRYAFLQNQHHSFDALERKLLDMLPKKMSDFIKDSSAEKWFNRRQLNSMESMGSSLKPEIRAGLAEFAIQCHLANDLPRACSLYLCLDQSNTVAKLAPDILGRLGGLQLACEFGVPADKLAANLLNYLTHDNKRRPRKGRDDSARFKENQTLFMACLKLGLIDEALQIFTENPLKDERSLTQAIEYLETSIDEGSLTNIDPILTNSTMARVYNSLDNNQILATHVITTVILSTTIFLLKLPIYHHNDNNGVGCDIGDNINNNDKELEKSILNLEVMFKQLTEYFDGLSFNTSESLVRSINNLVGAIKDKLDQVSESNIIRESFRQLVESTAGKCMIEGQYKSAAMLYNQIEDCVSAVKALMRMGELDIVINYSLLVRDFTVNRITINYLKHLSADPAVIDDFIAKSKL